MYRVWGPSAYPLYILGTGSLVFLHDPRAVVVKLLLHSRCKLGFYLLGSGARVINQYRKEEVH